MGMDGWDVVGDFIEVLRTQGRNAAIYRGQPHATWPLKPSVFRPNVQGITDRFLLSEWQKDAARFASPMPVDEIEWLVLAQHYGIATPLLDWTTSPLTALFFACADPRLSQHPGAVWRARKDDFAEVNFTLMVQPFAASREKPLLIYAVGRNARSTAQDSLLSLHTEADCEAIPGHRIFEVPSEAKLATLQTLSKLGFSAERLHQDISMLVDRFKANMRGDPISGWGLFD